MQPVNDALGYFIELLYRRPEVKLVTTYKPQMSLSQDLGVSAELHNGAGLDFWIDLRFGDAAWQMEYSVQRHNPDEGGSHSELDFPKETIESVSDLPKRLLAAIERLQEASATDALYR